MRVIVSKNEWKEMSSELQIELIAFSRMTGEDICRYMTSEEEELYDSLMDY